MGNVLKINDSDENHTRLFREYFIRRHTHTKIEFSLEVVAIVAGGGGESGNDFAYSIPQILFVIILWFISENIAYINLSDGVCNSSTKEMCCYFSMQRTKTSVLNVMYAINCWSMITRFISWEIDSICRVFNKSQMIPHKNRTTTSHRQIQCIYFRHVFVCVFRNGKIVDDFAKVKIGRKKIPYSRLHIHNEQKDYRVDCN